MFSTCRPPVWLDTGSLIRVRGLTKDYRVHERPPGLFAALRSVVHREYKTVHAVRDVSFEIADGERVGFLGPNGAGKTTTLKMLAGLLHPTSGEAEVSGFRPRDRQGDFLRSIMLVTGQKQQLLWDLPPAETFELNRAIYGVPEVEFRRTKDELVTLLRLEDLMNKPTRQLSLGERMKCELAAALIHGPKVLFLDEPTIGLDVTMQSVVQEFINTYNERHKATILLTSHYMDDVVAIAPRVLVINHGKLTYDGALTDLVRRTRPDKYVSLRFDAAVSEASLEALGGRIVLREAGRAVLQVDTATMKDVVTGALANLPVIDLKVEDAPIEEVLADVFAQGDGLE
jgi:ABC-2 type transport system ATP-binding protein